MALVPVKALEPVLEAFAQDRAESARKLQAAYDAGRLAWVKTPYWLPDESGQIAVGGGDIQLTHRRNYVFAEVPPGTYTLIFSKAGYARQVKSDVVVTAGQLTEVSAELSGEFTEMEEFVVQDLQIGGSTETGLLRLRQGAAVL